MTHDTDVRPPHPVQMDLEQFAIDADLSEDTEASKHYIQVLDALEDATDLLSTFNPFDRTQYKEAYENMRDKHGELQVKYRALRAQVAHMHMMLDQLNKQIGYEDD